MEIRNEMASEVKSERHRKPRSDLAAREKNEVETGDGRSEPLHLQ